MICCSVHVSYNFFKITQVKINTFKFGEEEFKLRYVVGDDQQVLFVGKDIASVLKYENCERAIRNHVYKKYKITYEELNIKNVNRNGTGHLQLHTILINKMGVVQLIMKSHMPNAAEFQVWFLDHVLPKCTSNSLELMQDAEANVNFSTQFIEGHVYVATTEAYAEKNLYKIGQTTNLNTRLAALNCGRASFDQLKYIIYSKPIVNFTLLEKLVKHELKSYQEHGEVYQVNVEHIYDTIVKCFSTINKKLL